MMTALSTIGLGLAVALAVLLLLMTLLPLLRVAHGAVRSCDFPRLQICGIALALAPILYAFLPIPWGTALGAVMLLVAAIQAGHVIRFTPLWRRQSLRPEQPDPQAQVSLLAANVKLSNRAYDRLIARVQDEAPDILMAIEVDADWTRALEPLHADFPHRIEHPLDNGYGMALFSRLPIEGHELRELLVEKVPSIRARIRLRNGAVFRLHVVHPEPPVPSHDSEGRDAELGLVGIEASKDDLPCVVAGDLNDVAWSLTTRRFQRLSGLMDPRVGRGFYNSFDARYPILRWPLDHLFHDPRFRLVEMRRLPDIGSDHFPMLFRLQLSPVPAGETPQDARAEDHAEIRDMAAKEAAKDREAVGSDWEDEKS
ncbi:hypothetical protein GVY41_12960 [Frigidibacter albus]|uniref:Endonuclease/exonuclease/phosphatase domain-containing protein n=1 Tax=Frigidibacter albus TaxID=1465486 RepID=A0A6L8VJW9_9RHOB|nr:endonuclease/exonuclease/phosphatase family protein [Frigidibacter albus]MZQ89996.1 hypothetical protein [Frigidibacter albus]NBE31904.1 hypothetical protein [Frigidibacter albus]